MPWFRRSAQERRLADCRRLIRRHGWMLQVVGPVDQWPDWWAYTAGLTGHGLPELIACIDDDHAFVLNDMAARVVDEGGVRHGQRHVDVIGGDYVLVTIAVDDPLSSEHCRMSTVEALYGTVPSAFQVVLPDSEHRFPWDEGYDGAPQPLLGAAPEV